MKKILTVLMAAAMLLAFSACGGSSGDKADPNLGKYGPPGEDLGLAALERGAR